VDSLGACRNNPPMRPTLALDQHRDAVRAIALRHRMTQVRVFGSVLHGTDTEASDLDLLVDPTLGASLMDIARIELELAALLKVHVDVLTPQSLPESFRQQVVTEAQPV
jgi:predicted nucleotidyltransferase